MGRFWPRQGTVLLAACALVLGETSHAQQRKPSPHGLYVADGAGGQSYLRFLEDGRVLCAASTGAPAQVVVWLHPGHPHIFKGALEAAPDGALTFTCAGESGRIHYSGSFEGDTLALRWKSDITGVSGAERYRFVTPQNPPEAPDGYDYSLRPPVLT